MTVKETFQHHLEAFGKNDINELMKDYTEESEIWTPEGPIAGLAAISSFYIYAFTLFPKDATRLEIKQMIVKGDKLYVVWNAESAIVNVPVGTDSFEIIDGKIMWQTTTIHIIQK
ncbi:MAG: nuclear transport factor 2 family protein [Chitinophagaceae bacterium]